MKKINLDNIKKVLTEKENIKFILYTVIGAVVILILIIVISLMSKSSSNEKKLESALRELGTSFYEDYYYDSLKNNYQNDIEGFNKLLESHSEKAFKVDLDNLIRVNTGSQKYTLEDFVNNKTNEICDSKNSLVAIYPYEPYGKTDYKIEITLVCGYNPLPDFTGYTIKKLDSWKNKISKEYNISIQTVVLTDTEIEELGLIKPKNNVIYKQSVEAGTDLATITTLTLYYYSK